MSTTTPEIKIRSAKLISSPVIRDPRGNLIARESPKNVPFDPRRCFVVFDVPEARVRGGHAHLELQQLMVCLRGSVTVTLDDGKQDQDFVLDSPELGLYVPPMIWSVQHDFTKDAMLLVLASDVYDPDDYIRDHRLFLNELERRAAAR